MEILEDLIRAGSVKTITNVGSLIGMIVCAILFLSALVFGIMSLKSCDPHGRVGGIAAIIIVIVVSVGLFILAFAQLHTQEFIIDLKDKTINAEQFNWLTKNCHIECIGDKIFRCTRTLWWGIA